MSSRTDQGLDRRITDPTVLDEAARALSDQVDTVPPAGAEAEASRRAS